VTAEERLPPRGSHVWPGVSGGDHELASTEHTTNSLRRRLMKGASLDERAIRDSQKMVTSLGRGGVAARSLHRLYETMIPLNLLAYSNNTEIQRDVSAAFNSISISDDNKPVFLQTDSLGTVLHLATNRDVEIREPAVFILEPAHID
jgi:hypothetical protein